MAPSGKIKWLKPNFLKLLSIFIKIKSLFNFDNCFGGSLIGENLEPVPPTKITTEIDFILFVIKNNHLTCIFQQVKCHLKVLI